MNQTAQTLSPLKRSLGVALGALLAVQLAGCDALARFTIKPDKKAEEPVVAEEETPAPLPEPKPEKPAEKYKVKPSSLYEWNGGGRWVTRIVIDTDEQKARFFAGDEQVGWSTVATGVAKHPTPTGKFKVIEKVENKRSNLYGKVYGKGGQVLRSSVRVGRDAIPDGGRFEGAHMPYFMRLTHDGVGLHAGPIPRPGSPASHGCIRVPKKLAPVIFEHVANGTNVEIVGKGPSYGSYLSQRRTQSTPVAETKRAGAKASQAAARKAAVKKAAPTARVAAAKTDKPASKPIAQQPGAEVERAAQAQDTAAPAPTAGASAAETKLAPPAESASPAPTTAAAQAPSSGSAPSAPAPSEPAKPAAPAPSASPAPAAPAVAAPKPQEEPAPKPAAEAPKPAPEPKPAEAPKPVLETKEIKLPTPKPAAPAPAAGAPAPAPKPAAPAPAPTPAPAPAPKPAAPAPAAPAAAEGGAG